MSWRELLSKSEILYLPWVGGRNLYGIQRVWSIRGKLPPEYGWYGFHVSGGKYATVDTPVEPGMSFSQGRKSETGYLAGDRFIRDDARVDPDPARLVDQTETVYLVERGLERFSRVRVVRYGNDLIYDSLEFPLGPESAVTEAYETRRPTLDGIKGVTPALDLAFRFLSHERVLAAEREKERLRRIEMERVRKNMGSALGRRDLAKLDFNAAAKAALAVSDAEFLDARPGYHANEMTVVYRIGGRRLECIADKETLQIIWAGICLTDHDGTTGDSWLTLESLPAVVREADETNRLVVLNNY